MGSSRLAPVVSLLTAHPRRRKARATRLPGVELADAALLLGTPEEIAADAGIIAMDAMRSARLGPATADALLCATEVINCVALLREADPGELHALASDLDAARIALDVALAKVAEAVR